MGKEFGFLKRVDYEQRFKLSQMDIMFKHWTRALTALCTIIHKGEMKSFQKWKNEFDIIIKDLFRYL